MKKTTKQCMIDTYNHFIESVILLIRLSHNQ